LRRGLDVAGVRGWQPWHARKWWESWRLWWAEEGGEGVGLGVLLEEGDVVIPGGLGGGVVAHRGGVERFLGSSLGMGGLSDLSWEVSGLSQVKFESVGSTVVRVTDSDGGAGAGRLLGEWHVDDVTVHFSVRHRGEQQACV